MVDPIIAGDGKSHEKIGMMTGGRFRKPGGGTTMLLDLPISVDFAC